MLDAKKIMWFGVAVISLIIFIFWGYSMNIQMSRLSWKQTPEGRLAQRAKTDWDRMYVEIQSDEASKKQVAAQIKNFIRQLLSANQPLASSTVSNSAATTTQ